MAPKKAAKAPSPLGVAAKAVVAPKGKEASKEASKTKADAASLAKEAPPAFGVLSPKQAEERVAKMLPSTLEALAESTSEQEQLILRLMLAYIGEKDDLSWKNAQQSCKDAKKFLGEMLEMEAGKYITKLIMQRMDKILGDAEMELTPESKAYDLALLLEASRREWKKSLPPEEKVKPKEPEVPPEWPVKIGFKELKQRLDEAAAWEKTALVVCCGHAKEADTYFTYSGYSQIDAKWVLGQTMIKKEVSVEDMQEELRKRVVGALKHGLPVHVAMSNTAVAFKKTFCREDKFPLCFFKDKEFKGDPAAPKEERPYFSMVTKEDLADWPGNIGHMKEGYRMVVTTDFDVESAKEFLPDALPHFEDMAIIEIEPASFK
ncbi:unnamed protein product [Effrenium voratum]|nr:unnamed protein product [Effrenium voratum]